MSTWPELYGKTLPVFFTQGYLHGIWCAIGSGQRSSAYQLAARELISDETLRHRWLTPLWSYFHYGMPDPQPLDYRFVALFQRGFQLYGREYIKAARPITKRVGNEWWFGDPPISTYQNQEGLQKYFAPCILAALDPRKFGAPGITTHNVTSYCDLGIIGITTFIDQFQQESGIPFRVQTSEDNISIEITECPFCLFQHDLCCVFAGIFEGLLDWMHGHWKYERKRKPFLTLNADVSTNHHIIIDIRHYGRK